MNRKRLNMFGVILILTFTTLALAQSIPEQEYLREQQALESGAVFGCFLVLIFMAAVIVIPVILCILVIVMCMKKRRQDG
ncbi:hypothetical protein LCGC14_1979890 [marine sediment metagenome]|uniref:Uncharacterized protein n=1 Tax=marine sediment metagenome TaxID=412755 RepID=A0A0F9F9M5_9ZZZZ